MTLEEIKLTPDHFAYFPSKCGLVDEDFPTPVIQLEIQGNIPWGFRRAKSILLSRPITDIW